MVSNHVFQYSVLNMFKIALLCIIICFPLLMEAQPIEPARPEYLYKIVSPEQWQESQQQTYLILSPMDRPFIHLSKADQVEHVAQKFWKDKPYVVLKLETIKLLGRLVYETNPGGTVKYYHLYEGKIPIDAVVMLTEKIPKQGDFGKVEGPQDQ